MQPGKELINEVRAGFVRQGTSLNAYCRENDISGKNVHKLLNGNWNGPKAKAIRKKIMEASKVIYFESA